MNIQRIESMQIYFKLFAWFFILDILLVPTSLILGYTLSEKIFFHFFKILIIIFFFTTFLFSIKFGLKKNFITLFFILYFSLAFSLGISSNDIGKVTFSHFFGFLMPILAVSFGQYYSEYATSQTKKYFFRLLGNSFWYLVIIVSFYFCLYFFEKINYFGMSSRSPYFVAYFVSIGNIFGTLFALFISILSGKRVAIILSIFIILIYFFFSKHSKKKKYFFFKLALIILFSFVILISLELDLFKRFNSIINIDFNNDYSLYLATGGRSNEIIQAINHINVNKLWLIGGGFGETYLNYTFSGNDFLIKHYSHFSPLYLVLVYGLPFTVILYAYFFKFFYTGLKFFANNFYFLVYASLLLSSFSGAILMIDIFFWVFLGISVEIIKYKKNLPETFK